MVLDQGEIAGDSLFQYARPSFELPDFFPCSQVCAIANRRIEGRDAGACRADTLREIALGYALQLNLSIPP